MLAYAACLFMSIKMIVDSVRWHAEDFETISGISKDMILKAEIFLMTHIINYKVNVSAEEFRRQYLKIEERLQKRLANRSQPSAQFAQKK